MLVNAVISKRSNINPIVCTLLWSVLVNSGVVQVMLVFPLFLYVNQPFYFSSICIMNSMAAVAVATFVVNLSMCLLSFFFGIWFGC